jgi:hypothetical protein
MNFKMKNLPKGYTAVDDDYDYDEYGWTQYN